jgi:dethiobiotin synthetase
MNGLFVLGTDTGVGKTIAAAAVAAALLDRGVDAGYMKPVGSDGVDIDGRLVSPDAIAVAGAIGLDDPWELINPVCLPGELSPLAAAEAEGIDVDLAPVEPAMIELARRHDLVIVEGVGGLLAPLTPTVLADDLIRQTGLPVLVVARPGLGTINHTLLTLEALERRSFPVMGFCYCENGPDQDHPSRDTNARHTRLFTSAQFLGVLPHIPGMDPAHPDRSDLIQAGKNLVDLLDMLTGPDLANPEGLWYS